jgi:hypothetical protein
MPHTSTLLVPWWDAYAADRAARPDAASIGPCDEAWLLLAGRLHARAQREAFPVAGGAPHADDAIAQAHATLDRADGEGGDVAAALDAVRTVAEAMERAGAFHLAGAVLRDAQLAYGPQLDEAAEAALLWQRARAARQAGDLEAAADGYAAAVAHARRGEDRWTEGRALLGAANVANMRGNYPEARARYREALRRTRDEPTLAPLAHDAHQGLALAAVAARDLDAALAHSWLAYRASDDADQRAHALLNAAEACRLANEDAAALRAALQVLEVATAARLRLPALGTAAVVASRLARAALVRALRTRVAREGAAGPYERAYTLLEFAEAWLALGDADRAGDDARAALALAAPHGFHEVSIRAETVTSRVAASLAAAPARDGARAADRGAVTTAPTVWSREARTALAGLHALPDTALALA